MRFVVAGLGSMGKRRIRLLKQISDENEIIGVDIRTDRREQVEKELSITTTSNFGYALDKYVPDGVIICTSPLSHASLIHEALQASCNVFTEINLIDDMYDSNILLSKEKGKVLFLSSPFLYRNEINYISERVNKTEGSLNYNYHVGQYLPDWHPWETIDTFFVNDKRTNGCRELLAVELPWLIKVFGDIESFEVLSSKITDLPIQYNDNYLLLIKHKNGNKGLLAVDIVSRKPVRNLEIYGENLYLTWDGNPSGLYLFDIKEKTENRIDLYEGSVDQQDEYASFIIEDEFRNELESFITLINGNGAVKYTFEEDSTVLSLIDTIEAR